jgi:hypothetical protein
MQDEFFSVTFRKKMYRDLASLQTDLDVWINHCCGKTRMQTFMESRNLAVEKMLSKAFEVVEII